MYIVWKTRPLKSTGACQFCRGTVAHGRCAMIPLIVASQRIGGRPRQVHVARLASIRSCCLESEAVLQSWWRQVDATLREFTKEEAAKICRLLNDGIARMKREGFRGQERRKETAAGSTHSSGYLAYPLQVLGLRWPCRLDEVKAAFRARAKQTHPDVGGRAEDFRAVSEAYQEVLQVLAS